MSLEKYFQLKGSTMDVLASAGTIGLHMVSGPMVGFAIGYGLDYWLGTTPWFKLIFFVIGIIAGFKNVYDDTRHLLRKMQAEDDQRRGITRDADGKPIPAAPPDASRTHSTASQSPDALTQEPDALTQTPVCANASDAARMRAAATTAQVHAEATAAQLGVAAGTAAQEMAGQRLAAQRLAGEYAARTPAAPDTTAQLLAAEQAAAQEIVDAVPADGSMTAAAAEKVYNAVLSAHDRLEDAQQQKGAADDIFPTTGAQAHNGRT